MLHALNALQKKLRNYSLHLVHRFSHIRMNMDAIPKAVVCPRQVADVLAAAADLINNVLFTTVNNLLLWK
jgi:hypothetical protein